MAVASLNFTGRKKITQERIEIDIEETNDDFKLRGKVDLSGLNLDPGRLVIELYRQQYRVRESVIATDGIVTFEQSFPSNPLVSALLAEVKVVSSNPADDNKILALAKQIRPNLIGDTGGFRKGLLPFTPKDDMGQVLWVTDLSEGPVVFINKDIQGWKTFCRQPLFQSLVMPEVSRDIAAWIWEESEGNLEPEDGTLLQQWIAVFSSFGADLSIYKKDGENPSKEGWVSTAVSNFSSKFQFLSKLSFENEGE